MGVNTARNVLNNKNLSYIEVRTNIEDEKAETEENTCDDCTYVNVAYLAGDGIFASFIVAPMVIGVWRGIWGLMDQNPSMFPYVQSYFMGIITHSCLALVRAQLLSRSKGAWSDPTEGGAGRWLRERIISRFYTCIFIMACLLHWRGGFWIFDITISSVLPDENNPHRPVLCVFLVIVYYASTIFLRSSRNLLATPYFLVPDGKEPTYIFTTRFRRTSSRETVLYVLDCIFSVAVVGSLVVFVWRGTWSLLDTFLFSEDQAMSSWTSLAGGYTLVAITFAVQSPVRWVTSRLHGTSRLIVADFYHLVAFFATVNVWRGVWGLLDLYLMPESPKLSNWCSHSVSLVLLMLLNCSNTVLVRGVYIDAEEPAGECVVFPCHYLRIFFHKERTKKRHRRILAAAAMAAVRRSEDASVPLQMPHIDEKV